MSKIETITSTLLKITNWLVIAATPVLLVGSVLAPRPITGVVCFLYGLLIMNMINQRAERKAKVAMREAFDRAVMITEARGTPQDLIYEWGKQISDMKAER